MAITATQRAEITKLAVAMFNVAPGGYLEELIQIYTENGSSLQALANVLASTPAFKSNVFNPVVLTTEEIAEKMTNGLGMADITTGAGKTAYDFFVAQLNAGESIGNLYATAVNYLSGTPAAEFNDVKAQLENKTKVAEYYTVHMASAEKDLGKLKAAVENVDANTDVATTAAIQAVIANTAAAATGQTFTLTTSVDNFVGGEGNDVFNGSYGAASTDTFNVSDVLKGGNGQDTLNIVATADAIKTLPAALVDGVETINVRNVDGDTTAQVLTVNASNFVGAKAFNADRATDSIKFSNLATGASIGVIGNGTVVGGAVSATYATATDAVTLNIADGTKMTTGVTVTGTATSATINSTGAANTIGTVDLANASLTSITINADADLKGDFLSQATDQVGTDGAVTISGKAASVEFTAALDNTIKTIDASGLTAGGLKATLGTGVQDVKGGAGKDNITLASGVKTVDLGAGDDTVATTNNAGIATTTAGSIKGGAGNDTLIVKHVNDVDTATERAVFDGFETLDNATTSSIAADGFTGVTALVSSGVGGGFTKMNATQAANITNTADQTSITYALTTSTGTSDVLTITAKNATATASADLVGMTVDGFETFNVSIASGNVDETDAAATKISFTSADSLKSINVSGDYATWLVLDNTAKAVTVSSTQAGTAAMKIEGEVKAGSVINATDNGDTIETALAAITGTQGDFVVYNAGAGDDAITTSLTALNNTTTTKASMKIDGGTGVDTVTFQAADASFADAQFQYITGVEKLTLANTSALSFTTGGYFDTNFKASGVTLTTGNTANNATQSIDMSSFTGNAKIVSTTAADGTTTADNVTIKTGAGADDVTLTASSWVGAAGAAGAIDVSTGVGDDTISVTTGTLLAVTGTNAVTITAGKGADTITTTHTNAASGLGNITYVIADGDSTAAARDKITGFDSGTASLIADTLDLEGTPTVATGTNVNGTDSGVIKSHTISSGMITFDDIDSFTTALTINTTNLSDVLSYLATNITTTGDTVAFLFDSNDDGTNDATIVFQQGANDTVVELVGVTGSSISTTNATTAGLIDLA